MFDMQKTGQQIASLRKLKKMTQSDLGDRLHVSYQAVSKWERGESLPDITVLVGLAEILETTVDNILLGNERITQYSRKITVEQIKEGLLCLKRMGELLGKNNLIYQSAAEGIDGRMNTDMESCFENEELFECWTAEAVMENILSGAYIDLTDVKRNFKNERFRDLVLDFAKKHGLN